MGIASINPATGETLKAFDALSEAALETKVAKAATTFQTYRTTTFGQRAAWLQAAAQVLEDNKQAYGRMMTLEMGKPLGARSQKWKNVPGSADSMPTTPPSFWQTNPLHRCQPQLCALPTPGAGAGRHALEFSLLAGVSLCRPSLDGGQCGTAETCLQRAPAVPRPLRKVSTKAGFPDGAVQTLRIGRQRQWRILVPTIASKPPP
jgi:succinate-semialdehyde dehydrogenase/glutarate-semialdehyde dehydrogenase